MTAAALRDRVLWHDLECGGYTADLPLWRELAGMHARPPVPVLDVGAGTGRVTLELARAGHEVVALDADRELLAELRVRAAGLPVTTVLADAREFSIGRRFGLVIAPMQTVQLLGGADGRAAFLRCAAAHLGPGARLAAALADVRESLDQDDPAALPLPDMTERDGWVYASQPLAVRVEAEAGAVAIERRRDAVAPDGCRESALDVVRLDQLDVARLGREAAAAGLTAEAPRRIPETAEHVGSEVAVLRA